MDKEKIRDLVIKVILIIIIIILLIHNCCMLKKSKNEKTPTGNVDIIEIKCDKDDRCAIDDGKDNKDDDKKNNNGNNGKNNGGNNNNNNVNNNSDDKKEEETIPVNDDDEELIVRDKDVRWSGSTSARIFSNSMYKLDNKIAPESSNTYQFVVKNGTKYDLKYVIEFVEDNPYNINMKYKLKKNDAYIVDHYISLSELNISPAILSQNGRDTYYLEWKWVSSDNDTEIGTNPNSTYNLKIVIKAESNND